MTYNNQEPSTTTDDNLHSDAEKILAEVNNELEQIPTDIIMRGVFTVLLLIILILCLLYL